MYYNLKDLWMKYIDKIKPNIYLSTIGLIIQFIIIGYITTIVSDENFKLILKMIDFLGIICIFPVIISIIECKKEPNMAILILNLLLLIVVFTNIYCVIYSDNNDAFQLSNNGIPYLDLLYFSFVTFTTLGYGDVLPLTYLAKFTAAIEAFMFTCVIAFVVLNFSDSMKRYLAIYNDKDENI